MLTEKTGLYNFVRHKASASVNQHNLIDVEVVILPCTK